VRSARPHQLRQRGGALVLIMLGLFPIVATGVWLALGSGSAEPGRHTPGPRSANTGQLVKAKAALLAYAVSYADNYRPTGAGPGHFPCPDLDPVDDGNLLNDGPDPPCGRLSRQIGRLPRQTFTHASPELGDLPRQSRKKRLAFHAHRSTRDQQPWYVVSPGFANNPLTALVNPASGGKLQVDGVGQVVAIILAPGNALPGQASRRPGDRVADYLEGENADGDLHFSRRYDQVHNDQLISITTDELLPLVERRVLGFVRRWLLEYQRLACPAQLSCFPYAATGITCTAGKYRGGLPLLRGSCQSALAPQGLLDGVAPSRHWFVRNRWPDFIQYELAPECAAPAPVQCSLIIVHGSVRKDRKSLVSVRPLAPL